MRATRAPQVAGPEEAAAYEELRAQLVAEHPRHLPLLLERVRRLAKLEGDARDAAALQVCRAGTALRPQNCCPCKQALDSGGPLASCVGLLAHRGGHGAARTGSARSGRRHRGRRLLHVWCRRHGAAVASLCWGAVQGSVEAAQAVEAAINVDALAAWLGRKTPEEGPGAAKAKVRLWCRRQGLQDPVFEGGMARGRLVVPASCWSCVC